MDQKDLRIHLIHILEFEWVDFEIYFRIIFAKFQNENLGFESNGSDFQSDAEWRKKMWNFESKENCCTRNGMEETSERLNGIGKLKWELCKVKEGMSKWKKRKKIDEKQVNKWIELRWYNTRKSNEQSNKKWSKERTKRRKEKFLEKENWVLFLKKKNWVLLLNLK